MQKKDLYLFAAIALVLFGIVATPSFAGVTSSNTINAVITVTCSFGLSANTFYPVYLQPYNVMLGYTYNTFGDCTLPFLNGNMIIVNSTGSQVYQANFVYQNTGGGIRFYNTMIENSIALGHGSFTAYFNFSSNTIVPAYNQSSVSFDIDRPANILLTNFTATPSSSPINSQIAVRGTISNNGDITAGNVIVNLQFTSPLSAIQYVTTMVSSIAPGTGSVFEVSLGNVSGVVGNWGVVANVTYNSILSSGGETFGSSFLISNNESANYTITSAPSGGSSSGPSQQPLPPASIGELSFSELPLFMGVLRGDSATALVGLTNNGSRPLWVNLSTSSFSAVDFGISATSVYLLPKETQIVSMSVKTDNTTPYGSYAVPIAVKATVVNGTPYQSSVFINLRVSNGTMKNLVTQSVSLLNYSNQAAVQVLVRNPTDLTLYNSTVLVQLPLFLAKSASDIMPSGALWHVTEQNNEYIINYTIPELLPGQNTNVYYSIKNVVGPEYLSSVTSTFTAQTSVLNNTLKLIDLKVPTFYVNQQGVINVTALYVGPVNGNATFTLSGPAGVHVAKPFVQYRVFPNMVLTPSFIVGGIAVPGTYLMTLHTTAPGANQSYQVPIIVLQGSNYTTTPAQPGTAFNLRFSNDDLYALLIIVFVVALAVGVSRSGVRSRRRHRKDVAERLVHLKEQIGRGNGEE